MASKYLN